MFGLVFLLFYWILNLLLLFVILIEIVLFVLLVDGVVVVVIFRLKFVILKVLVIF